MPRIKLFRFDLEGRFVRRPNRFTVVADTPGGEVAAHCPNPGRMKELLVPGRKLILERRPSENRKTAFTLVATEYRDRIIPLYSAGANRIAAELLLPRLFPQAVRITPEYRVGASRFDFLVTEKERKTLVEVKSCTLIEEQTAMFPDAPTKRGTRHIAELASLSRNDRYRGQVLFVVAAPDAQRLVPDIHTDKAFAVAAVDAASAGLVGFHAATIRCSSDGEAELVNPDLRVDFSPCAAARKDGGVYLLRIRLADDARIQIGALGEVSFGAGEYIYVGSGRAALSGRIARHLRRRKRLHWHIDYLIEKAARVEAVPIRSLKELECALARDVETLCGPGIPGFGASDCDCPSHLFRLPPAGGEDPLLRLILRYRHAVAL